MLARIPQIRILATRSNLDKALKEAYIAAGQFKLDSGANRHSDLPARPLRRPVRPKRARSSSITASRSPERAEPERSTGCRGPDPASFRGWGQARSLLRAPLGHLPRRDLPANRQVMLPSLSVTALGAFPSAAARSMGIGSRPTAESNLSAVWPAGHGEDENVQPG